MSPNNQTMSFPKPHLRAIACPRGIAAAAHAYNAHDQQTEERDDGEEPHTTMWVCISAIGIPFSIVSSAGTTR